MLFIVAVALLLFLPHPWNLVGFTIGLVLGIGELFLWNRTVRHRRPAVGASTLIGVDATVLSACRPDGQVQLNGEIWEASCAKGASPGETVRVVGRRGLTLLVERVS